MLTTPDQVVDRRRKPPKRTVAIDIDRDLYETISDEADALGISVAAAIRLRLRTGRVPRIEDAAA